MPTSYSSFTPDDIAELGVKMQIGEVVRDAAAVLPSSLLQQILALNQGLPLSTEKAKSEFIVAPILNEIRQRNNEKTTFFSGYNFNVDAKRGLKGRCDFIFSLHARTVSIQAPLFCVIEAKNDTPDDENNFAQCLAEMYAARLFNEKRKNEGVKIIYGAVTNGYEWIFLKLENDIAYIDSNTPRFSISELPQLLGVLQYIIDAF